MSAIEKITRYLIEHDTHFDWMSVYEIDGNYVLLYSEGAETVVIGQTYAISDLLKEHGFSWDGTCWRKVERWHIARNDLGAKVVQFHQRKAAEFGSALALAYSLAMRGTFTRDAERQAYAVYNGFFSAMLFWTNAPRELKDHFLWRAFGTLGLPDEDKVQQAWTYVNETT